MVEEIGMDFCKFFFKKRLMYLNDLFRTLAWNLINDVNTKETEALINKYVSENKETIANNKRKQDEEAKWASYTSEREKLDKRIKFENYKKELDEEKKRKEKEQAEIIEELVQYLLFVLHIYNN